MTPLKVLVSPDFRELAPYQALLSNALEAEGVQSVYLTGTRRVLPLTRAVPGSGSDVLHLHWIEHLVRGPRDVLRRLRLLPDLWGATRRTPLVYTVHDLYPTGWPETALNRCLIRGLLQTATALIVHSPGAFEVVCSSFGVPRERCTIIPHGDQTPTYGPPIPRDEARAQLGLGREKLCVAFGAILANKGVGELVEWWAKARPAATLAVVGQAYDEGLAHRMSRAANGIENIELRYGFQSDSQVNAWFSAADCMVTNYQTIFTSGVACLARSWGVPVLLPQRLTTIDLMEPDPTVLRYQSLETDFGEHLLRALTLGARYECGASWRRETAWAAIATRTAEVYRKVASRPTSVRDFVRHGV